MQIDNLYPSDVTDVASGITFSAFTENIDGIEDNMADAYLMGYLPPEMVAPSFRPVILSGGGDSVSAVYDYSQNYGWGYIFRQGSADGTGGVNYVNQNGVYTRLYNVDPDYRFINAAEMSKYCTDDTVTIYIAALAINKNYWDSSKMATTQMLNSTDASLIVNVAQSYTFAQWRDIIKNDTVFYSQTVDGHTIELRPSDFGDSNDPNQLHVKFFESGDKIIRADIYNYIIGGTHYMNLNSGYSNYIITPFVQAKISAAGLPDTVADVIPGTNLQHFLWMRYTNGSLSLEQGQTTGVYNYDYIPDYNVTFGGFNNGTISVSDIDFSTAGANNQNLGFVRNWYLNYSNGVFRIVPTFTPLDIYHHMMLFHKHTNAPSGDYSSADTVTVFTTDDTPTMDTVSGTLTEIAARLRPWQFPNVDISSNTFTPEDIPEPTPGPEPGGEPDEGDRGVSIPLFGNTPPKTDFLHQAAFPVATIQSLATQLWNQPDNFWQKIVASTSENPMDYFISLRYYPLTFTHGDGENVLHIGRGGELSLGSNYYPLFPVESFDFGTITIQRQYYNFLDYAPYTRISIFLPYAGTFELNPTIVMGRTLKLWLDVDCTDGSGVWTVYNQTDSQPVLIKQCRLAAEVPLSGIDASQMAANIINASLQTAQHTLSAAKTDLNSRVGAAGQALSGNLEGAISGAVGSVFNGPQAVLTGLGDAYNLAQASKEIPQYTGGSTGAAACSANNTPYIIYRRPLCTNPVNFAHTVGNLVNKTAAISSLNGFTTCRNVDISGIGQATDKEKAQIKQILESGFYA